MTTSAKARAFLLAATVVAALTLVAAPGCRRRPAASALPSAAPAPTGPAAEWVTLYAPALALTGYTLTLHEERVPVLLDMNGRVVHSWPEARVKSRVRLLADGSILGLGLGRQVVQYDWDGRQTWSLPTPGAIPHHDVLRLANGNTLVPLLVEGESADTLVEAAPGGQVVWRWRAAEHRRGLFPARPAHPEDVTHINSIQEIPENRWHAAGDRRFRPGNLLVSARNLNTIFIVDRPSGEVVWTFTKDLDRQHEARMNGPNLPEPGMIQVFNNRLGSFWGDHQSEVIELDPRGGSVVWRYRAPGFFSSTGGVAQKLPNGNVLVTSTRGGRVFEITRAGRLVWEWVPPYDPVRAVRVAPDACPQLARLASRAPQAVNPPRGYHHVDPDAYRFARQGARMAALIEGEERMVLKEESACRDLVLPAAAEVEVGYGVDRGRLRAAGRAGRPPQFAVRLSLEGASAAIDLLRDTVGLEGPAWRERTIALGAYSFQAVELCLEIDGGKPGAARPRDRFAYWELPDIVSRDPRARRDDGGRGDPTRGLNEEELEVRRRLLRSLGYVN